MENLGVYADRGYTTGGTRTLVNALGYPLEFPVVT